MTTRPIDMIDLYRKYHVCMVRVTTEVQGRQQCGGAFHIGDGWLVSAKHVVCDGTLLELKQHDRRTLQHDQMIMAPDDIDLVLLHTDFDLTHYMTMTTISGYEQDWKEDHISIGGHLDDWISDDWMILTEVLLMGYPPIPGARERQLVASRGEVNSIVDMYVGPTLPHFVISQVPRGGFSGGPVLASYGDLIGIMTQSLVMDGMPAELGYGAALTVEPLWGLLMDNKIYPGSNADFIRELQDPGSTSLSQ